MVQFVEFGDELPGIGCVPMARPLGARPVSMRSDFAVAKSVRANEVTLRTTMN